MIQCQLKVFGASTFTNKDNKSRQIGRLSLCEHHLLVQRRDVDFIMMESWEDEAMGLKKWQVTKQ